MMIVDSAQVWRAMLELNVGTMQVAKDSGLPTKTISNFVTADRKARVPTINRLAKALQVPPMELVKKEAKI